MIIPQQLMIVDDDKMHMDTINKDVQQVQEKKNKYVEDMLEAFPQEEMVILESSDDEDFKNANLKLERLGKLLIPTKGENDPGLLDDGTVQVGD